MPNARCPELGSTNSRARSTAAPMVPGHLLLCLPPPSTSHLGSNLGACKSTLQLNQPCDTHCTMPPTQPRRDRWRQDAPENRAHH
eukprot:116523-Pyramimonas_sp.AAC.1